LLSPAKSSQPLNNNENNTTCIENINIMPQAGLSDSQKADLYKIWSRHSAEILSESSTTNTNGGNATAIALDERSSNFVARLTSFFLYTINIINDPNGHESNGINRRQEEQQEQSNNDQEMKLTSALYDTFKPFFPSFSNLENHRNSVGAANSASAPPPVPRMTQGRHIVTIDHSSFLSEMEAYEGRQYLDERGGQNMTFGAFLYHKPSYGLCVINCAIALALITLHRRARFNNNGNDLMQHHLHIHTRNGGVDGTLNASVFPPESILIIARFQTVFPTIEIQDVKTSNAYKFISLQGRIIKTHPKRLRLLNADVMCIKCGHQFEHMFKAGRYELPDRCNGIADNNGNGKKCQGQKFELLRRTAKYIDCQMLKLQEEDNANSTAGRTPRHLDLEVTHDLVDVCHAGDCVRVTGVIQALNSAVASGRGGKRAAETSTYRLYMKANSIVNTTAEFHDRKKKVGSVDDGGNGDANRGLTFTDDQLQKITRVAHAGEY